MTFDIKLLMRCGMCLICFVATSQSDASDWGCGLADYGAAHVFDDIGCWGIDCVEPVHIPVCPPPVVKTVVTQIPTFTYETQLQPVTVYKPVLVKRPGVPKTIVTQHLVPQHGVPQHGAHQPVGLQQAPSQRAAPYSPVGGLNARLVQ